MVMVYVEAQRKWLMARIAIPIKDDIVAENGARN